MFVLLLATQASSVTELACAKGLRAAEQGCHHPELVGQQHRCVHCERAVDALCFAKNHSFHGKPEVYFCGTSMGDCCVEYSKPHLAPQNRLPAETLQATSPASQPKESTEVSQAAATHILTCAAGSRCTARSGSASPKSKTKCCQAPCYLIFLLTQCQACLGIASEEEEGPSYPNEGDDCRRGE